MNNAIILLFMKNFITIIIIFQRLNTLLRFALRRKA
jgi:hypothetical protein